MLFVFIYDAIYFLLFFALNMWTRVGIGESFLKYMYELMTHPLLVFFNAICLFLFPAALSVMVNFDSLSPVRSFTFDRQRNLLIIESYCFFWHRRVEYSLNEIQSLQWLPQSVYAGGMTMADIQFLKLTAIFILMRHSSSSEQTSFADG